MDDQPLQDSPYQPCDKRYRTSRYFLEDQLRCSAAVEDFRSVKSLIDNLSRFNQENTFRFRGATVSIRVDD